MKVTKELLKSIRADLDVALAGIAKKYELKSFASGKCVYSPDGSFTFKCDGIVAGGLSKEAERYNANRVWMKLPELGTTFTHHAGTDKIVGLNTTATKVLTERDGKNYLWPVDAITKRFPVSEVATDGVTA